MPAGRRALPRLFGGDRGAVLHGSVVRPVHRDSLPARTWTAAADDPLSGGTSAGATRRTRAANRQETLNTQRTTRVRATRVASCTVRRFHSRASSIEATRDDVSLIPPSIA